MLVLLPFLITVSAPPAPKAGVSAIEILKPVVAHYHQMKTFSGRFHLQQQTKGGPLMTMSGTFKVMRPKIFDVDIEEGLTLKMTCDGKVVLFVVKSASVYSQVPLDDLSMNRAVSAVAPMTLFFNPDKLVAPNTPSTYLGKEKVKGVTYQIVEQKLGPSIIRSYISDKKIVERMKVHADFGGQVQDVDVSLLDIKVDAPLKLSEFSTEPPAKFKPFEMMPPAGKSIQVGERAPEFSITTPSGGSMSLSQAMQGKKTVLVTFWFYACASCRKELPLLQKLYEEKKALGFEVVAIDSNDDRASVTKYLKEAKLTFPIGLDDDGAKHYGVVKSYGVGIFPTSYLLDSQGKVIARFTGWDEKELRSKLEGLLEVKAQK